MRPSATRLPRVVMVLGGRERLTTRSGEILDGMRSGAGQGERSKSMCYTVVVTLPETRSPSLKYREYGRLFRRLSPHATPRFLDTSPSWSDGNRPRCMPDRESFAPPRGNVTGVSDLKTKPRSIAWSCQAALPNGRYCVAGRPDFPQGPRSRRACGPAARRWE